jgi:hypothetical protein
MCHLFYFLSGKYFGIKRTHSCPGGKFIISWGVCYTTREHSALFCVWQKRYEKFPLSLPNWLLTTPVSCQATWNHFLFSNSPNLPVFDCFLLLSSLSIVVRRYIVANNNVACEHLRCVYTELKCAMSAKWSLDFEDFAQIR